MSLLNQVLQDLQDRQAPDTNAVQATLRDVRVPVRSNSRAAQRPWVLWVAIIVLAGVSGNLLWQRGQQNSAPPVTSAAVRHPAQQPTVTHSATAIAPAVAPATTSAPNRVTPIVTASAGNAVAAAHAPVAVPAPQVQISAVADAATTAVVATKKLTAAITTPVSKPTVEKTARPLSPEQQADLSYQDALRLLQSGRPSAAEPRLHSALDSDPAHRAARTALAGLLINAGRLPEARTVLAAGLALAPTYAPFAKLYARLRIDQGELRDARAVLERAAPPVQDDPEYHALLAALYQRLGLYEQAAQTYRGTLQAQPRNGVWWLGLGLALEGAGDRANALQAYQRAQQSGTLDSEVLRYVESKITALR